MSSPGFAAGQIEELLVDLATRAAVDGRTGAIRVVGGSAIALMNTDRRATHDIDAVLAPADQLLDIAHDMARLRGLRHDWLNDAVKDYLSERGEYRPWLESSHLRVMVAQPAYLLAMKCLAFRIGAEFHDEDDVRFLLRLLDLRSYAKALETIGRYYPKERFPQKTLYALAELLPED